MHIPFNASERSSLGIEVELGHRRPGDRGSWPARPRPILDRAGRGPPRRRAPQGQARAVRVHARDHHRHLRHRAPRPGTTSSTRSRRCSGADRRPGPGPAVLGHPPVLPTGTTSRSAPSPRYAGLIDEMQWAGQRLQIFGVHFHVGVRSAEKVIAIANALNAYIPHFLALSASSPYWEGHDTGLASCRSKVFESLPTAGLPYQLAGLGRVRGVHGDAGRRPGHHQHPRGVVGHPAPPRLRHRRAAHLRRHPHHAGGGVAGGPGPEPGGVDGHPPRRGRDAARAPGVGGPSRTSGGPPATASTPRSSSTTRARRVPLREAIGELVEELSPDRAPAWAAWTS